MILGNEGECKMINHECLLEVAKAIAKLDSEEIFCSDYKNYLR